MKRWSVAVTTETPLIIRYYYSYVTWYITLKKFSETICADCVTNFVSIKDIQSVPCWRCFKYLEKLKCPITGLFGRQLIWFRARSNRIIILHFLLMEDWYLLLTSECIVNLLYSDDSDLLQRLFRFYKNSCSFDRKTFGPSYRKW